LFSEIGHEAIERLRPEIEDGQNGFKGQVVMKKGQAGQCTQLLTYRHFANGGRANDENQGFPCALIHLGRLRKDTIAWMNAARGVSKCAA